MNKLISVTLAAFLLGCSPAHATEQQVQEVYVVETKAPFTLIGSKLVDDALQHVSDKYVETVVEYCDVQGVTAKDTVMMKAIGWTQDEAAKFMADRVGKDFNELQENMAVVQVFYNLDMYDLPIQKKQSIAYDTAVKVCYDARTLEHPLLNRKSLLV